MLDSYLKTLSVILNYLKFLNKRSQEFIYGFRTTRSNSLFDIKNLMSFQELCEFSDSSISSKGRYSETFFGNPLPKSYATLGAVSKGFKVFDTFSILQEINWVLLSIRKYKSEIDLFLAYRKIFEDSFIIGDYENAEKYLKKIENEICCSLWSLQNRMLLLEWGKNSEENKTFLSETNKIAQGIFIPSLSHFLSNKSEKNLAVSRFDQDVSSLIQRLKGKFSDANREFYYFKLNKFYLPQYSHLKEILSFDSYHSVIDRYLTLVEIIKISLSDNTLSNDIKKEILNRLAYLIKKFNDPELSSLASLQLGLLESAKNSSFNSKITDLFISGIYSDCISLILPELKNNPCILEYYLIYVNSHLFSNTPFKLPTEENNYQNAILKSIYELLNRTIDPNEAVINIQRIIKNLSAFQISCGLHKFINDETNYSPSWKKYDVLALSSNNAEITQYYEDQNLAKSYLDQLSKITPHSIAVSFQQFKLSPNDSYPIIELNIPLIAQKIEKAKYHLLTQNYLESKEIWIEIIIASKAIIPIYELAIEKLFHTYVELNELDEAISLYVNNFIENNYLVYRINTSKIIDKIRRAKFKNVSSIIDLPLFYTFIGADENEKHIAYEKYNKALNITRPSQLTFEQLTPFSLKWVLYLHATCTTEIFKHSIYIDGSKDGYSERINVCKLLLNIDKENENIYKNEITELTDSLIIQEGLQQLDESKIYVNESGLINSELKEFEGLFNRYHTIANIYKKSNKGLIIIDKRKGLRLLSLEDIKENLNKDSFSSDPLRDAFADIFDVITRKFLFSKFGISAYLSTRIRHGVLLGEIRPIFEKYNLISEKDNNSNEYKSIEYWNLTLSYLSQDKKSKLQKSLGKFSKTIDSIIDGLLVDSLQIKTEDENPEGWLDYYFDDTTLSLYAIKLMDSTSFPDFVKKALEILWERTDQNLQEVRNKLSVEIKGKFSEAIAGLSSNVEALQLIQASSIFRNINTCLTEIDNVTERISGWFNRSGSKTSDFKLDKLISVVIENVSHSYPRRQLKLRRFEVPEVTIKGEFYMHWADLFRIFLDNALKHSDQNVSLIEIEIAVEVFNDLFNIVIQNSNSNPESLKDGINLANVDSTMKKLSTEGKSGFPKATKIIRSDFDNESNYYKTFADDQQTFKVVLSISLQNLIA